MVSKDELYISIAPEDYRKTKSNVLISQADLLITLKRLHNLKVLSRQKNDFKKRLHKLLSLTLSGIDSIQEEIPTTKLPKSVQKEEPSKLKASFPKRDEINDELILIREKLRELNS
ncbi:hypothetical protein KAI32_03945 [Candidatus Pacearchaeota archaeon]|nr:hypothetical protein [Candidatus Pacearchaeota archaeon]